MVDCLPTKCKAGRAEQGRECRVGGEEVGRKDQAGMVVSPLPALGRLSHEDWTSEAGLELYIARLAP